MMTEEKTGKLESYLEKTSADKRSKKVIAQLAAIDALMEAQPDLGGALVQEIRDQRSKLKLIASENYTSLNCQIAMGNLLTDKYAEGFSGHRFYSGCSNIDTIESAACDTLKELFGCEHAYVQPHSGADANLVAFSAILFHKVQTPFLEKCGKKLMELTPEEHEILRKEMTSQKMLAMGLGSGGHISHGYRFSLSSKLFESSHYEVSSETGLLDYDAIEAQAKAEKPLVIIAGYSAYPRLIDFEKMRLIADSVGAVLLADIAHFAGLVAGGVITGKHNPIPYAHIVTSTTHKTLRGPRGGIVMCKKEFKESVDQGCPMILGGPLPHVMLAKAIAFREALTPEFKEYSAQVIKNAKALSQELVNLGAHLVTGGTDNHLFLIDVMTSFNLTGRQAANALAESGIIVNRNAIPFDSNGAWYTSGVRMGTPALTSLGMKEGEMKKVARLIFETLKNTISLEGSKAKFTLDEAILQKTKAEVQTLLNDFPLYPELVI